MKWLVLLCLTLSATLALASIKKTRTLTSEDAIRAQFGLDAYAFAHDDPNTLKELEKKTSLAERFHNWLSSYKYPEKPVRDAKATLSNIKTLIKTVIDPKAVEADLYKIYATLQITTAPNKLNTVGLPALAGFENVFFAPLDISRFLDEVEKCSLENDYLMDVIARIPSFSPTMPEGKPGSAKNVLSLAVALGIFFERFDRAVVDDYRILKQTLKFWPDTFVKARGLGRLFGGSEGWKKRTVFGKTKYITVEYCMEKVTSGFEGKMPSTFMRQLIPINIYEAVAMDIVHKNWDNVRTGRILATHPPGYENFKDHTGAGPSLLHVKNASLPHSYTIHLNFPLGENWSDLYGVWNMAFTLAEYPQWPLFWAKLLTPPVLCQACRPACRDEVDVKKDGSKGSDVGPQEYIYRRGIALWAMANFLVARPVEDNENFDWHLPKKEFKQFLGIFGAINRHSANHYEDAIKVAKVLPAPQHHTLQPLTAEDLKGLKKQTKRKTIRKKRFHLYDDLKAMVKKFMEEQKAKKKKL